MGTKYFHTPCGPFEQFEGSFLFQEMLNRRLIFKGDSYKDVVEQLYRLKSGK